MSADVAARIEAVLSSTRALQHTLEALTDDQCRQPSLLPGWSRGHVLTHLARNADALRNLVHWARTGEERRMYPSREERNAAIEAGSGRSAADLRADVAESSDRLIEDLRSLTDEQSRRSVRWGRHEHETTAAEIPQLRRTEVEIHHVDLDLDYTLAHWPEDFVEEMLSTVSAELSRRDDTPGFVLVGNDDEGRWTVGPGGPEINGPPPSLLGWLIGRTDGAGLHCDQPLPRLEAWR